MKVILLGDLHFDSKNGDQKILDQQMRFFYKQLIPYMEENNIKHIIQTGDMFDNRKSISLNVQQRVSRLFSDTKEIHWYTFIGNHDMWMKTDRNTTSLHLYDSAHENLTVFYEQDTLNLENRKFQIVPFLTPNESFVPDPEVDAILGHFEIQDFNVTKTFTAVHGLDSSVFRNIPVYSGHFHLRQSIKNIHYIGTPFQNDWSDYKEMKGFDVLDLETMQTTFVENVYSSRHLKCTINVDSKTVKVEGFKENIVLKINNSLDYSIFENNRLKIYCSKELAVVKKFLEGVEGLCRDYKLEIIKDDEVENIEELIENAQGYEIEERVIQINEEEDRSIVQEIIIEAKSMMVE